VELSAAPNEQMKAALLWATSKIFAINSAPPTIVTTVRPARISMGTRQLLFT
jgi:hypothetical protein